MQILTPTIKLESMRSVSLDVDGTIIPDLGSITPELRAAVSEATSLGVHSTINSARTWQGTRVYAEQISTDPKLAPWEIAGGGVFVTKPCDLKPYIVNHFSEPSRVFNAIRDVFHRSAPTSTVLRGLSFENGYHDLSLTDGFSKDIVVYAALFHDGDRTARAVCENLRKLLPIELARVFWYWDHKHESCWIQVTPGQISKGTVLDTLEQEEFQVPQFCSAHAGDSWNDMCAYRYPGTMERNKRLAVVVESAPKDMLNLADIRIRRPEEGGIESFYQLLLSSR